MLRCYESGCEINDLQRDVVSEVSQRHSRRGTFRFQALPLVLVSSRVFLTIER